MTVTVIFRVLILICNNHKLIFRTLADHIIKEYRSSQFQNGEVTLHIILLFYNSNNIHNRIDNSQNCNVNERFANSSRNDFSIRCINNRYN